MPIVIADNIFDSNDDKRIVERNLVEETVKRWRCSHIECNVKENMKIVKVFEEILNQSNINYDLNEAVNRRKRSLSAFRDPRNHRFKLTNKNACTLI